MVDDLAIDMQDQRCHGVGLEPRFATALGKAVRIELADAVDPSQVLGVESSQSPNSRSGVLV